MPTPDYYRNLRGKADKGTGKRAEDRTAKRLGARLTPASGALEGAKGDFSLGSLLCEHKSTVHDSLTVQLEWLAKITREAIAQGKSPALAIAFTTEDGRPRQFGKWVAIPEVIFQQLIGGE